MDQGLFTESPACILSLILLCPPICINTSAVHVCAQSCLILCNPVDCSPPGSSVHGISQARILEWVAVSSFRRSPQPGDQTQISCNCRWGFFTTEQPGKPISLAGCLFYTFLNTTLAFLPHAILGPQESLACCLVFETLFKVILKCHILYKTLWFLLHLIKL